MGKEQELIVITKTYDLILWSCNHTSKFPRNHRFVLGERIERNLCGLLETLIAAKYTKQRQRLLEEAKLALEILRFQMRLAKDMRGGSSCRFTTRLAYAPTDFTIVIKRGPPTLMRQGTRAQVGDQHEIDARRGAVGPEKVPRRRAALAGRR